METEFNLSDLEAEFYLRCDKCRIEESYAEEDDDEDDNKIYWKKDVKEFIKNEWKCFIECRDKTDVWGDERWNKFEKMFKKERNKLAGDALTNGN